MDTSFNFSASREGLSIPHFPFSYAGRLSLGEEKINCVRMVTKTFFDCLRGKNIMEVCSAGRQEGRQGLKEDVQGEKGTALKDQDS